MIRTMPDPIGPAPMRVPREAMLRELGLTDTPAPDQSEEPSDKAPEPLTGTRVGRNAPCPCGSGKKYKKCCGRDA